MQMLETAEVIQVVGDTHANEKLGRKLETVGSDSTDGTGFES